MLPTYYSFQIPNAEEKPPAQLHRGVRNGGAVLERLVLPEEIPRIEQFMHRR